MITTLNMLLKRENRNINVNEQQEVEDTKTTKKKRKVSRSRIVSLEHSVYENKFTIKRADGTKQFVHQFNQPEKYAYYLRTYGYSYQSVRRKQKRQKRKKK